MVREVDEPVANSTYPKVAVQWLNQVSATIKVSALLTVKCFEIATFGFAPARKPLWENIKLWQINY